MPPFVKVSTLDATSIFRKPRDAKKIKKAVDELLKQIWIDGGGVFAKSLAAEVLVESGESVGSLEPLARFTRTILRFRSAPKLTRKRPQLQPTSGKPIPGTIRSFATGVQAGQNAFDFNFSSRRVSFEFRIPVFQFALHETGRNFGAKTSMFNAMSRAHIKQREHVTREFRRRMPQLIGQWLATGEVRERPI